MIVACDTHVKTSDVPDDSRCQGLRNDELASMRSRGQQSIFVAVYLIMYIALINYGDGTEPESGAAILSLQWGKRTRAQVVKEPGRGGSAWHRA